MDHRRTMDDFIRGVAVFICCAPVGTYCALHFANFIAIKTGSNPVDIKNLTGGLENIVLTIIGSASVLAFQRRLNQPPEKENPNV